MGLINSFDTILEMVNKETQTVGLVPIIRSRTDSDRSKRSSSACEKKILTTSKEGLSSDVTEHLLFILSHGQMLYSFEISLWVDR